MADFGDLLKKGRDMAKLKDKGGKWGRCEECNEMTILYNFIDKENEKWELCEQCSKAFIEDIKQ